MQDGLGARVHGVSLLATGSRARALMGEDCRCTPVLLFFSWRFTCTNLWKACVHRSLHLQMSLAHSPVLVHRIDLFPLAREMGVFYVDEVIIADTNLTGDHRIHSPPWTSPSNANFKLSGRGCSPVNGGGTGEVQLAYFGSTKKMGLVLCALGPYISLANSSFFPYSLQCLFLLSVLVLCPDFTTSLLRSRGFLIHKMGALKSLPHWTTAKVN